MKTLDVNTGIPYKIYIEHGILNDAGKYIREVSGALRAVIISDSNVAPLYASVVESSLKKEGFETSVFVFEAGEERKRLSTIERMYMHFFDHNITRTDIVVALGGGVTGDMAGFAAASYLRGIDFVQIPTSLLSQVDSSVGGKTGVDLPGGKNLVGAFWQPRVVLIDPDTLDTLPAGLYEDGMGEVIKYGCIKSKGLFELLEKENARDITDDIISRSVEIKRDVVSEDEREAGLRAILNFGHTFGHAMEKLHGYSGLTHGEAVGIGALMLTEITEAKGLTEKGTSERIRALLEKNNMPTGDVFTLEEIIGATRGDKKTAGKELKFVFLRGIGDCYIHRLPTDSLMEFFTV